MSEEVMKLNNEEIIIRGFIGGKPYATVEGSSHRNKKIKRGVRVDPYTRTGLLLLLVIVVLLVTMVLFSSASGELPLPPPPPQRPPHAETSSIIVFWDQGHNLVAYIVPEQGNTIYCWPDGETIGYVDIINIPKGQLEENRLNY
jgi:hypothetical protein